MHEAHRKSTHSIQDAICSSDFLFILLFVCLFVEIGHRSQTIFLWCKIEKLHMLTNALKEWERAEWKSMWRRSGGWRGGGVRGWRGRSERPTLKSSQLRLGVAAGRRLGWENDVSALIKETTRSIPRPPPSPPSLPSCHLWPTPAPHAMFQSVATWMALLLMPEKKGRGERERVDSKGDEGEWERRKKNPETERESLSEQKCGQKEKSKGKM